MSFPVTVTARQVAAWTRRDRARILGLPLADAQAILDAYGTAELQPWPDWVGTIPTIDGRVEVTIDSPVPTGPPARARRPMSAAPLGVDLGARRIGLAIADAGALSVRPLTTIPRGRDIAADAEALRP